MPQSWPRILHGSNLNASLGLPFARCLPNNTGPTTHSAHTEGACRGTRPHQASAYRQGLGEAASSISKRTAGTGPQYGPTPEPTRIPAVSWPSLPCVRSSLPSCSQGLDLMPGGPHTADDPRKTPSEAHSPSGRPPFLVSGPLLPIYVLGTKNQRFKRGKRSVPPEPGRRIRGKECSSWG